MKKPGLTLLELLISMVVLGILLTTFTGIYANSIKTMREQLGQSQTQTEAQTILDRIITEVKKSKTTTEAYGNFTLGSETLILDIPSIDASQNIIYNGLNPLTDKIIYYKTGSQLRRVVFASPSSARASENNQEKVLSNSLSSLTFTYTRFNNSLVTQVKTDLGIAKIVGKVTKSATVSGTATFRNLP